MPTATGMIEELEIGAEIPAFSLPATQVGTVGSAELRGKPFVLYFYPKDNTSVCTAEACSFRDALSDFTELGIAVVGVSRDSLESHDAFAKKYKLQFPLASDEKGEVSKKFGVLTQKSINGNTSWSVERSTFLIDGNGILRAAWRDVSVPGHIDDVKKAISEL
jgi:peroxiredoxin Q/BCP